ncbi:MAG: hypothetical protein LQ346_004361 [Caloplaca aetnensis]|nr:MAG: hypothetical protein LQ346_004361 [Caloplaca aetnensis]
MKLPFELRAMVYREVFVPAKDTPIRNFVIPAKEVRIHREVIKTEKEHLAILLTNKQISGEASGVLYDDFTVKLQVAIYSQNPHGAVPENASVEHPFRHLRNVEIELDTWLSRIPLSFWQIEDANRGVAIFCDEMVFRGANLKKVVVRAPCLCEDAPELLPSGYSRRRNACVRAAAFERITEPLRRLRVSHSIELQCSCEYRSEIGPVFDRLTSEMRGGRAVRNASCIEAEMVWLKLRRKAEPYLGLSLKLRDTVSYGWAILKRPGAEKGADAITVIYLKGVLRCVNQMMSDLHGPGWETVTYEDLSTSRTCI